MAEIIKNERLPDFFPTTLPNCKEQTNAFFKCFNSYLISDKLKLQATAEEIEAYKKKGELAMNNCKELMNVYTECMHVNYA